MGLNAGEPMAVIFKVHTSISHSRMPAVLHRDGTNCRATVRIPRLERQFTACSKNFFSVRTIRMEATLQQSSGTPSTFAGVFEITWFWKETISPSSVDRMICHKPLGEENSNLNHRAVFAAPLVHNGATAAGKFLEAVMKPFLVPIFLNELTASRISTLIQISALALGRHMETNLQKSCRVGTAENLVIVCTEILLPGTGFTREIPGGLEDYPAYD